MLYCNGKSFVKIRLFWMHTERDILVLYDIQPVKHQCITLLKFCDNATPIYFMLFEYILYYLHGTLILNLYLHCLLPIVTVIAAIILFLLVNLIIQMCE